MASYDRRSESPEDASHRSLSRRRSEEPRVVHIIETAPYPQPPLRTYSKDSGGSRTKRTRNYAYAEEVPTKERPSAHYRESYGDEKKTFSGRRRHRRSGDRRRSRSSGTGDDQGEEEMYNEAFGGISIQPVPISIQRRSRIGREHSYYTRADHVPTVVMAEGVGSVEAEEVQERFYSKKRCKEKQWRLWDRASPESIEGERRVRVKPTLLFSRRGVRCQSRPFTYVKDVTDDYELAVNIKECYRTMKLSQIGFLQKVFAYKTIAYVFVLQFKWINDATRTRGRWQMERFPITSKSGQDGRDAFLHRFRTISTKSGLNRTWCKTIDQCIESETVIDLEISESFDSAKLFWGLLLGVLLSLAAALLYGFFMDHDFGTGFSIASWMITVFAFLAAVVAAGEFFGLERPTSFQVASESETQDLAKDMWKSTGRSVLSD